MEAVGRYIACILAVILLFLFPVQYLAQTQEETIDDIVISCTQEFADTARNQGYITCDMYDSWKNKLDQTGELYDISIEAMHPVSGKEMADVSVGNETVEVKADQLLFSGRINGFQLMSTHSHSADCYTGTLHVCNGIDCGYAGQEIMVRIGPDYYNSSSQGYLEYSLDKSNTWTTAITLTYGVVFTDVTYGNGKFIASTSDSALYYSTDGIIWTRLANVIASYRTIRNVAYRNGKFYAFTTSASGIYYSDTLYYEYTSTDGITWSYLFYKDFNGQIGDTKIVNNYIFLLTSNSTQVYYISPTSDYVSNSYTPNNAGGYYDIEYYNGTYYAVADYVWTSTDLTNWIKYSYNTSSYSGLGWYVNHIISNSGKIFVLGSGKTMVSVPNGQYYNYSFGPFNLLTLTSLPIATYSRLPLTYDGSNYYLSVNNGNVYTTGDFSSWNTIYASSARSFVKIIVNSGGGYGKPDLGPCLKAGKYYDTAGKEVNPVCGSVVTAITATNPVQTVDKGGSIITTATAAYLDGHYGTVSCTSNFNPNFVGAQIVTLTYFGLVQNARTTGIKTCNITVTVRENNMISYLSVIPSSDTIYNGNEPSYTVTAFYTNGSNKILNSSQYVKTGWTLGPGIKSISFSYTESSITVTASINITVLPNLTAITVSPTSQNIKRYSNPDFTIRAHYEDGSSKVIISGYTVSGFNNNNLGTQTAAVSYSENGIIKSAAATITVNLLTVVCPICKTSYELDSNDIDNGCPNCAAKVIKIQASPTYVKINMGTALPITLTAVYQNGRAYMVTGWTSNYNPSIIGVQEVQISYQSLHTYITVETIPGSVTCPICNQQYRLNDDGTDPGCPLCRYEVVSINILEESVTIQKHQPLPITVTARYKDGHTATITDWSTNFIPDSAGVFEVTVFYQTKTNHLTVKVIDENYVICPYCSLEYDRSVHPFGCPVCSKTLVGIEAKLRNGGTQVIYKSQLNLQILLIYRDTHRMLTYTGYTVSGYHSDQLGFQTVIVHYNSFSTMLTVEVIAGPTKVICPNDHEYYRNEDGSDPGCPYCNAAAKDKAIFYFETTYSNDIINAVCINGIYYLNKGDYLTVTITHRDVSLRNKLRKMFFLTNSGINKIKYTFGGEVKNVTGF